MAKSDYSKVEDEFSKKMENIKIEKLRKLADGPLEENKELSPVQMMVLITHHIKWMKTRDKDIHKNIRISRKEFQELHSLVEKNRDKLRPEEIEHVKKMYAKVQAYKDEHYPFSKEDEQIDSEKGRHIYKRHNINEKWLPLDVPPTG